MYFAGWWSSGGFDSVMDIRLNRLVLAVLVGVSLATSGVALQALLRNPLAEPYVLGLSSGAGVGLMAQMLASHYAGRQFGAPHLGALGGAAVSMAAVYAAGRKKGMIDPLGLLLVGVVLSTINGAIIVLLNYIPGSAGPNPLSACSLVEHLVYPIAFIIHVSISRPMGSRSVEPATHRPSLC